MAKKCEAPNCKTGTLVKMEHESTWTVEKYYCSNPACGRIYQIPTTTGKTAQVAPLATAALLALSVLTLDIDGAVDHAKDLFG